MQEREDLRRRLLAWSQRPGADHYPKDLVRDVVAYARRRMSSNASRHGVALELDMAQTTLNRWLKKSKKLGGEKSRSTALVPVRIVPDEAAGHGQSSSGVVMTSPSGWRVEVVEIEKAITLLRALS